MSRLSDALRNASLPRGEAFDLCARLGQLARWVVSPEVTKLAAAEDPMLLTHCCGAEPPGPPTEVGSCWVVFVRTNSYPNLRPAFALPLRWRAGEPDDGRLPAAVRDLAGRVRTTAGVTDWGLGFADGVAGPAAALSGLDVQADSGWVPLYGGLRLALDDLQPRPDVWATGAWDDERGVVAVDEVTRKAAYARALGARQMFVPAGLEDLVSHAGLEPGTLARLGNGRLGALDEYLLALGAPPSAPRTDGPEGERMAAFRRCRTFWRRLPPARATAFYRTHLLDGVVRQCRARAETDYPGWRVGTLVTVVSGSPELVQIAAEVTGAGRVVLLHTRDGHFARQVDEARSRLQPGREVEAVAFDGEHGGIERSLAEVLGRLNLPGSGLAFDLTPGTKRMTLALDQVARATFPGADLIYLDHRVEGEGRRPDPETIRLVRWAAG